MKIALVNPPFLFFEKSDFVLSQCTGLRYISSYLKAKSCHQVVFIDALMQGFSTVKKYANGYIVGLEAPAIVNRIPSDSDMIGISVPFSQLAPIAHDLAARAKDKFPKATVVMGGMYPSTQPRLALTSRADMIVVGEGERAFYEIVEGADPRNIKGVYSRDWPEPQNYLPTQLIEDLDTIPFPDDSIPNIDRSFRNSPRRRKGCRTAAIITSRGCPNNCEFCSIHPVYDWDRLSAAERDFVNAAVARNLETDENFFPRVLALWIGEFKDSAKLNAVFSKNSDLWPKLARFFPVL